MTCMKKEAWFYVLAFVSDWSAAKSWQATTVTFKRKAIKNLQKTSPVA